MSLTGFTFVAQTGADGAALRAAAGALEAFYQAFGRQLPVKAALTDATLVQCDLLTGPRAGALESGADCGRAAQRPGAAVDVTVCFDGWLENGDDIARACGVGSTCDADLVLAAWGHWGEELGNHLAGEYSFAIWDARTGRLFALRDKVGVRPLFYALTPSGGCVVGNLPGGVAAIPGVNVAVDRGYAAEYLCAEESSFGDTLFAGVKRLPGGHQLSWDAGSGLRMRRYWRPRASMFRHDAQDAQTAFAGLLERVVERAAPAATPVACDLSGGVDSSSVAVQLGRLVRSGARAADATAALSLVYPGLPCDESPYIAAVAAQLPFVAHAFAPRYASLAECVKATAMLRYPFFPYNATGAQPLVDHARDRGGILLSGEGGDELFEPTEHALRGALVRPREWLALHAAQSRRWAQSSRERSWLGSLRHAIAPFAGQPLVNLLSRWRDRPRSPEGWPVDAAWAEAVGLRNRVDRLLYPRNARTLAMGCALSGAWSPSFEWLFFAACVAGVESRHPLSSATLIEFCNRLPLALLDGQEDRNRLLLRRAGGTDLPAVIAERTSKAEFTPATLPALLERARRQVELAEPAAQAPPGASVYYAQIGSARHIWRLDAALSLALWLQSGPAADTSGMHLSAS